MQKTPDYLAEGEGYVDVTLSRPLTIDGAAVSKMRLREPTVDDQLTSDAAGPHESAREIALFSNLTEVAPADIKRLPLRDYKRLQVAIVSFFD